MFITNSAKKPVFLALLSIAIIMFPAIALPNPREADRWSNSNLGAYFWQKGDYWNAITEWQKQLESINSTEEKAIVGLKIARARINLGQNRLAIEELQELAGKVEEDALLSRIYNQLGNAFYFSGDLENAFGAYTDSIEVRENLSAFNNLVALSTKQAEYASLRADNAREEFFHFYNNLAEKYSKEAVFYAKKALSMSEDNKSLSSLKTLLQWQEVSSKDLTDVELQKGRDILTKLPPSREKIFSILRWAEVDAERAEYWLSKGLRDAINAEDAIAQSYVFLQMGLNVEKVKNYDLALNFASQAQLAAGQDMRNESLYRSFWLAGRIYKELGDRSLAIESYRRAIATLDEQSSNVTSRDKIDIQRRLEFSTTAESIYREYLDLLLVKDPNQSEIKEAVSIFDKIRLAQLRKYFGDNCIEITEEVATGEKQIDSAVVIYSIILEDRTHFILRTENDTYHYSNIEVGKAEINEVANRWYENILLGNSKEYVTGSRYFYNALALPFEQQLETIEPTLIVFVHDGILRNLPMAAMLDEGGMFFAQKYPSISSIGLDFEFSENSEKMRAVAFGLEAVSEGLPRLDRAEEEVTSVVNAIGGNLFVNEEFTKNTLEKQLEKEYSILHIATHGYFGGIAEDSFLLAYEGAINALELEEILINSQNEIELLVLSACETSIGSDLSVLGLAGIALRSGIESVMGTLWSVQDVEQAEFIESFYQNIGGEKSNKSLAAAMQTSQIEFISEDVHPMIWAANNLIVN